MRTIDVSQTLNTLANIGVIAGIIFLGIEINQNTTSIEVGAYQELTAQISRINELAINNPRPWMLATGDRRLSELTPEEQEVASSMALLALRHGDMAFYQYERGMLSDQRLESALAVLTNNLCAPNVREVWSTLQGAFVPTYRNYIDARISECQ